MIYTEPVWKSLIVTTDRPMFTPEQCELIIRKGKSLPPAPASTGEGWQEDKEGKDKGYDTKIRKSTVSWIPFHEMPEMYREIEVTVGKANNNHFGYDGILMSEFAQFTEYKASGEHYAWHMDSGVKGKHQPPVRKISMSVPLVPSTDYEGGQLEFLKGGDILPLQQGQAVFFSSFLYHRLLPVTKGTRYSLVQWFTGPPFK